MRRLPLISKAARFHDIFKRSLAKPPFHYHSEVTVLIIAKIPSQNFDGWKNVCIIILLVSKS